MVMRDNYPIQTTKRRLCERIAGGLVLSFVLCGMTLFFTTIGRAAEPMGELTDVERAQFAAAKFAIINNTKSIPRAVADALRLGDKENLMADPGQPWAAGCVVQQGQARRCLIFAGQAESRCFVFFEQGGIAHFYRLDMYQIEGNKATLLWTTNGIKKFDNIAELKKAIEKHEFK